jgi:Ca2+:H+ antiporter
VGSIALVKNEIRIVQASLLGSILANLLLILGMCFCFGGLRFREQIYNSTVTQMSACLLCLAVMSLLLPVSLIPHLSLGAALTCSDRIPRVVQGHGRRR